MKTIKKQLKRAFTIVELVIVIAVIAVLAAVLIPTFVNVINSANVSNDTALAKNMNTTLTTYGTLKGKPETPHEALEALEEDGYLLKNMTPTADGYSYIWDQNTNSVALITEDFEIQYSQYDDILTNSDSKLWAFVSTQSEVNAFQNSGLTFKYCITSDTALTVDNDFDSYIVANANVTLSASGTSYTIYTDGGEVTINAANATVNHYGNASLVTVTAVAGKSYHVYGEVKMAVLTKGHLVVEKDASVSILALNNTTVSNTTVEVKTEEVSDAIGTIYTTSSATTISVTTTSSTGSENYSVIQTSATDESGELTISSITYVSTKSELESFIAGGAGMCILQNDIDISTAIVLSSGQFMMIDLNGYTLTSYNASGTESDSSSDRNKISESSELTISDGTLSFDNICSVNRGVFVIESSSKLTLNNVTATTNGSFLFPKGDAAEVNVIGSTITTTGSYCVATNSATVDNYGVEIYLQNSTLKTEKTDDNACPVMINVEGNLTVDNCKIYGQSQGVIVRAGTAKITNTVISCSIAASNITSDMQNYTTGTTWKSGTEVALAAVVVGNSYKDSAYKADAVLTMSGCTLSYNIDTTTDGSYVTASNKDQYEIGLYMIQNCISSDSYTTTVTITNCTINDLVVNLKKDNRQGTITDDSNYTGTIYTTWSNNAWTTGSSTETENE